MLSLVLLAQCKRKDQDIKANSPALLTRDEIVKLVDVVAVQPTNEMNFHLFYKEYLNDSTWVILILQNHRTGSERFGVCDVINYNDSNNIFVYGDKYCNDRLDPSVKLSDDWPLESDGINFTLLVEMRNGILEYYTLKKPFIFDGGDIDTAEFKWWD